MKLFRLRFIVLGIILCVCHVRSRTCGTPFNDTASSAFLADAVVVGTLSQKLPPTNRLFNVTIQVSSRRNVLKGAGILKPMLSRRGSSILTVGEFGLKDVQKCVADDLENNVQYIFYLKILDNTFLKLSAMPVSEKDKKEYKRAKKNLKKILKCKRGKCVKPPEVEVKRAMKDTVVDYGKPLTLTCRLGTRTLPVASFTWLKDGRNVHQYNIKGLHIRNSSKSSKLRIRKANLEHRGTYECIASNIGGEIKQQALVRVTGISKPQIHKKMRNKEIKFGKTIKQVCRIKGGASPNVEFTWLKDGVELKSGSKEGLTIRNKANESTLRKKGVYKSDEGNYTCVARNDGGEVIQHSHITVLDAPNIEAPKKKMPCLKEDSNYCLNNGTCEIMVELESKFCTCRGGYGGERCASLTFDKTREDKLATDRIYIIVGITYGILLFIGICVASYFLAKYRREQFYRRRRQRNNIEDNIPQVYRPLIGCDETDGLKTRMNGAVINKETQTHETCFLNSDKTNLYINPLEGYVRNDNGDRNSSRSRKQAVSLEEYPKTPSGHNSAKRNSEPPGNNNRPKNNNNNNNRIYDLAADGAPNERMNDLSPRRVPAKPSNRDHAKPVGAIPNVPNIPNVGNQTNPPAISIEYSDSDDEVTSEGTPLTPLHISEDEDNTEVSKPRTNKPNTSAVNMDKHNNARKQNMDMNKNVPIFAKCKPKPVAKPVPKPVPKEKKEKKDKKELNSQNEKIYASTSSSDYSDSSSTTEGCDSPNTAQRSYSDEALDFGSNWNERGSPEPPPPQTQKSNFFQFPPNIQKPKVKKHDPHPKVVPRQMHDEERKYRLRNTAKDQKAIHL